MANDTATSSPKNDTPRADAKEDAETRAARRELKQSSISDPSPAAPGTEDDEDHPSTPDNDAAENEGEDAKDQVASPKKKRGHDQLDSSREKADKDSGETADSTEPEKKRARDEEGAEKSADPKDTDSKKQDSEKTKSAFEASAFGKLAAGTSPFTALGGANGSTGFASPGKKLTSFASGAKADTAAISTEAPKLTFGGTSGASPFGGLPSSTNGFGSTLGSSGFSSLGGAKPLGSFASTTTSKPFAGSKSAKPFGAPDSDVEDSNEDDDDDENEGDDKEEAGDKDSDAAPEKESEDKKKLKLQKVDVDDGEAGDVTLISVRCKMFVHEKDAGWKERGAGMVKINVPQACVEFDDAGAVVPGSFDASGLDNEDGKESGGKVARILMRQDQTHRVILNTPILPVIKFQDKSTLKSASATSILFTAFDGPEATPLAVTIRMNSANAKLFLAEISSIQRELQDR